MAVTTNIQGVPIVGTAQTPIGGPAVRVEKQEPSHIVATSQVPTSYAHVRPLSTGGGGGAPSVGFST